MATGTSLVSVVIPTYNHARYIGDAIGSVLRQEYRSFEIIVVDDGSTDHTQSVVKCFGSVVRYVWQENRGLSAARNAGIQLAAGEFVGLLDADDMYEPQFMSTLTRVLDENPEAMASYCGYRFVDDQNRPLPQVEARNIPSGRFFQALVDGNFLVPESMLVRRRCYEDVGPFDESLRACEDLDMWLRIARRHQVVGTAEILTRHRVLPVSMSTDAFRQCLNRLSAIRKQFGPEVPVASMNDAQRRAYGSAYLTATVEHLQSGHVTEASELLVRMMSVCPELLLEVETFYELGCGDQPKGYRGDFASLDVTRNEAVLLGMLRYALDVRSSPGPKRLHEGRIWAQAYLALALLYYGKRELRRARTAVLRGLAADPGHIFDRRFVSLFARSFLHPSLIDWLRRQKPRVAAFTQ